MSETTPTQPAIDHDAPTETHVGSAPIPIDPDQDVLSQIVHEAQAQGRAGLEGLVYDYDGTHYVVEDQILVRANVPHKNMRKILPSFSHQYGGAHTIEYETEDTAYVTVKGYGPDGQLATRQDIAGPKFGQDKKGRQTTIVPLEESPFAEMLNDLVKHCVNETGSLPTFSFAELPPEPTRFRTIPVDVSSPEKSVFDTIMDTVKTEDLSDGWVGLTWARDGYTRWVVEDNSRSWDTADGPRNLRQWVIDMADPQGRIVSRNIYDGEQLRKHLQVANTPPNPPLNNLRFEVPVVEEDEILEMTAVAPENPYKRHHWREEQAWLGWLSTEREKRPIIEGEDLSFEDALNMLSYGDVYEEGGDIHQRISERIRSSVEDRKYIRTLQEIVKEVGSEELWDTADNLLAHYNAALQILGFRPRSEDRSMSWVFKELARHRFYANNPDDVPDDVYHDLEFQDPIGSSLEAKQGRNNVIDLRLGAVFANIALRKEEEPVKKIQKITPAERKPNDSEFKEVIKGLTVVSIDEDAMRHLQTFIREEINEILSKAVTGRQKTVGAPVTQYDMARIGELLRQAAGQ